MERAWALRGEKCSFAEEENEKAQAAIRRNTRIGEIDKIELVTGQLKGLGEIKFKKIFRDRKGALEIEPPDVTVRQNAQPNLIIRLNIGRGSNIGASASTERPLRWDRVCQLDRAHGTTF